MVDKASVFLLVTILVLVTIVLVFAMKYFAAIRQASQRVASEDGFGRWRKKQRVPRRRVLSCSARSIAD
jgi:hypothetical protein